MVSVLGTNAVVFVKSKWLVKTIVNWLDNTYRCGCRTRGWVAHSPSIVAAYGGYWEIVRVPQVSSYRRTSPNAGNRDHATPDRISLPPGPADRDSGTLSDQADPPDADDPAIYGGTVSFLGKPPRPPCHPTRAASRARTSLRAAPARSAGPKLACSRKFDITVEGCGAQEWSVYVSRR